MLNEAIAFYDDGDDITGFCTTAVGGKRFVKVAAARQPGGPNQGVTDAITGGNISIAVCGAGDRSFGVSSHDQALGRLVDVMRPTKVVPVVAGAAISAGQEVQSDATGAAIPLAAGKANGYAIDDAANGADAQIALY